jgi:predicted  nucleic acid-binding Zn ribbon protein
MTTEKHQFELLTNENIERAAMLANVILDQARYKGFTIRELYCALKIVNLHLERGLGLKVSRWDENSIDWYLSRSYLPG